MKTLEFKPISSEEFLSEFPSEEQMRGVIASCESSIETSRKGMEARMENYYNCLDDYSFGGICDKAASENIAANQGLVRAMEAQIENGPQRMADRRQVLCDMEGRIVTQRIVNTRYGSAWIYFPNGEEESPQFVSLAKRQGTYEKKGFRLMTVETEFEYYFCPQFTKEGLWMRSRILRRELVEPEKEEFDWSSSEMHRGEFRALNA
jgi:hypothetical protein